MSAADSSSLKLILASRSPRRRALLEAAGMAFEAREADIHEPAHAHELPRESVMNTALAKAERVALDAPPGSVILAADTSVAVDGDILNKPADRAHAREMLARLSGRAHEVYTGIVIFGPGGARVVDCAVARVVFHPLGAALIDEWVESGEADDKAGAYGIQQLGRRFPACIEGDLTCVIGLPMLLLQKHWMRIFGADPFGGRAVRDIALAAYPDMAELPPDCLTFDE